MCILNAYKYQFVNGWFLMQCGVDYGLRCCVRIYKFIIKYYARRVPCRRCRRRRRRPDVSVEHFMFAQIFFLLSAPGKEMLLLLIIIISI